MIQLVFTVQIQRGRWIVDPNGGIDEDPPRMIFEGMESDWQTEHPGVPTFLAAKCSVGGV